MLLLALLLIPVATAAASFFARRREEMEAVNLAGFGAGLSRRHRTGRAGARPRHGLAGKRLLLCRCAQRAGDSSHRFGGAGLRDLLHRLPARRPAERRTRRRRQRQGAARTASHVLHADAAVRLLHDVHGGGQQSGSDVGGDRSHHAGLGLSGHLLWQGHLA